MDTEEKRVRVAADIDEGLHRALVELCERRDLKKSIAIRQALRAWVACDGEPIDARQAEGQLALGGAARRDV